MPPSKKGSPIKTIWIRDDEAVEVCADLLCIINAGRLDELARRRLEMLRQAGGTFKAANPWVAVEADRIATTASKLVGGSAEWWLNNAFTALGRPSRVDVCIAAIREVADEVEAEQQPDRRPNPGHDAEPDRRQQAGRQSPRVTLGRKRGRR